MEVNRANTIDRKAHFDYFLGDSLFRASVAQSVEQLIRNQ
jgi:hypothetical protein